jgi:hypothetical protein
VKRNIIFDMNRFRNPLKTPWKDGGGTVVGMKYEIYAI